MMTKTNRVLIHLKSSLARITLTPHTLAFFLISIIHCVAQGLTAAFIYSEDASSFTFLNSIMNVAEVPRNEIAHLLRSGKTMDLEVCTAVPIGNVYSDCETIWSTDLVLGDDTAQNVTGNGTLVARFLSEVGAPLSQSLVRRTTAELALQPVFDPTNGTVIGAMLTFDNGNQNVTLSKTCARTLEYPQRILDNSWREDIALIVSQFWLLGISAFAILYNSIPNLWAVVFARVLQTAWASYTLWRTFDIQYRYDAIIVGESTPCHFDLLPMYFTTRVALQIPELVLNVTALISTAFLAWHVVKGYSASTIRRAGPPAGVMRLYRFFLIESMFMQLSLFFTVTAASLWLDQMRNSSLGIMAKHPVLYYSLIVFTIATIIPWMVMGWFSIRREIKPLIAGSLLINLVYIGGWGAMFDAQVFLWTFLEWPFFTSVTIVSFLVLFGAAIFSIICWTGFGRGLAHYLHVEQVLLESDFDADVFTNDTEKASPGGGMSPVSRSPSALSELSGESNITVVKKDTNWDFADVNRPPIYTVDVKTASRSAESKDALPQ